MLVAAWAGELAVYADGPLAADGATDSLVQVFVPGLGPSDTVRVSADGARVVAHEVGPQGTVFVTLRPHAARGPGEVALTIRTRGGVAFDETLRVPVAPVGGRLGLTLDPPSLDGAEGGVLVRIQPAPGPVMPHAERQITLAASVGSVSAVSRMRDGTFSAVYTPPEGLEDPVAVLFTAIDLASPERVVGRAVLPIRQRVRRVLDAPPGAEVSLVVGGAAVGTVTADPRGLAGFDLWLGPGDATGVLKVRAADGARSQATVDLDNPARPQIAFAPWPTGTGVPAGEPVSLWLAASDPCGAPRDRIPELAVRGVGAAPAHARGEGWHEVIVQAPPEPGPLEVEARLGVAASAHTLRVVPSLPVVTLSASPIEIGQSASLTATARFASGRSGRGDDALVLRALEAPDAAARAGDPVVLEVPVTSERVVTFVASTDFAPTGLPPARLRVWTGRAWAPEAERVPLFVVVEDALGVPLPDQRVTLRPHPTLIGLPEGVDTGASGWAMVTFSRSDTRIEPIPIEAESGWLTATAVLWPHAGGLGTADDVAARARWAAALPALTVQRQGPPLGTAVDVAPRGPTTATVEEVVPARGRAAPSKAPLDWSVGVGLADVGIRYLQTSASAGVPETASFREPLPFGAFGGWLRAEITHASGFGGELFGRVGGYRVVLDGQPVRDVAGAWRLGATWQRWLNPRWGVRAGLGFQRTDALGIVFDDRETALLTRTWAIQGARLGGEALGRFGVLTARAGFWETFALAPAITEITLRADVRLPVEVDGLPLSATAGLDLMFRHAGRALDAGRVRLDELQGVVLLGVALGAPPAPDAR